jgi:hypothetical protein
MPKSTAAKTTAGKPTDEAPRAKRTRRVLKPSPRRRRVEPRPVSHEQIALRAYELHLLGQGADAMENWLRAERELVGA